MQGTHRPVLHIRWYFLILYEYNLKHDYVYLSFQSCQILKLS